MDMNEALKAHAEWKVKLRSAISKKESLDAAKIALDNCCALGMWLHGESKIKYGRLKSHGECVSHHAAFHRAASAVAKTINDKKYPEAEAMLGMSTPFANASTAVAIAIGHLKKEAGL